MRQLVWRQHGLDERDLCDITHRESLVRCGGGRVVEMKRSTGRKRSKGRVVVEGKKNGQPKAPRPGIQASRHPSIPASQLCTGRVCSLGVSHGTSRQARVDVFRLHCLSLGLSGSSTETGQTTTTNEPSPERT